MANQKGTGTKAPGKKTPAPVRGKNPSTREVTKYPWTIVFWLAFAILIFGLFLYNREAINSGIQTIQNAYAARDSSGKKPAPAAPDPAVNSAPGAGSGSSVETVPPKPVAQSLPVPAQPPASRQPVQPDPKPQEAPAPAPAPAAKAPAAVQSPAKPAAGTSSPQLPPSVQPKAVQSPQTGQTQPELRDRALYFSQVDRSGSILRVKVNRKLPVSDSPMTDVIQALISGPTADEKSRGLISLIPPGTRILSATVRGETAYISFSEDFQYNAYGVEGYAGQLRQIVFTVTEFPNITDVQILIEGRRVDYLGEGIWIGSPLNRDKL